MNDNDYNSLQIIFYSLLVGQVVFMVVAFVSAMESTGSYDSGLDMLIYVVPGMMLAAHLGGRMLFNIMISKEKITYSDGKTNVNAIRSAYIVRWALMEGPNLLAIVGYIITSNVYFCYFFLAGVILYLTLYPKRSLDI